MPEIIIYDRGKTRSGIRYLDIRVILKNREARSSLKRTIADAIWQALGRLRLKRGVDYDFFVDASSPRWVGVECPSDPYTKKRVIGVANAVAESHHIKVSVRP